MPRRMIVLHSIDKDANRFRFFVLEIHERPDGQHELVRRWGRIGTEGRANVERIGDAEEIAAAFEHALTHRQRRGYRVVEETAAPPAGERELGSLIAWEARLVDALVRTRKRLTVLREGLRPTRVRTRRSSNVEQLDLFAVRRADAS